MENLLPFLKPGSRVLGQSIHPLHAVGALTRIADVGSGSGYLVACLHHVLALQSSDAPASTRKSYVLGPSPSHHCQALSHVLTGRLWAGIEHISELGDLSLSNLRRDGLGPALDSKEVEICVGDGRDPDPKHGGEWDAIHVGAAAPEVRLVSSSALLVPADADDGGGRRCRRR